MKRKVIISSPSKEELEKMINKFYYSENYIITDDNKVYNKLNGKYIEDFTIVIRKNRWQYCRVEA